MTDTRIERDSLGELKVPKDALWGAQTQRAVENFPISDRRMPRLMIRSLGLIKAAAARANAQLGLLDQAQAQAIVVAAEQVASGQVDEQFPVDIFQTGSGTSSNMNANEVIASLCAQRGVQVHPNDHVNMSQSSNDVIPTAIHLACALGCAEQLMPGVRRLIDTIEARAEELDEVAKTGRTHLMDAMPVTFGQELRAWSSQLDAGLDRLVDARKRLYALPQGGTAVGSGINAHHEFGSLFAEHVSALSGLTFSRALDHFAAQAALDTLVDTIQPFSGDTDIFITPGYRFRAVDGLMTNFHLPKSTLMMLVSALMGRERMMEVYAHAIAHEYRFYSYGDSSLLLPPR